MWKWFKEISKDYEEARKELAKNNIFFAHSWHGIVFYYRDTDKDKNDDKS